MLAIAAGIAVGVVVRAPPGRLADPLIDLSLFRDRAFSTALAAYVLGTFVAFGLFVFVAQYMQLVLGMSPLEAGLWSTLRRSASSPAR